MAFPGVIKGLPILWWDLALLFLMWCTSAVVVGGYLSYLTQAGGEVGFEHAALAEVPG
jgi:hypothetical protein